METFWENIIDFLITFLKVFIFVAVLRGLLFIAGVDIRIPYLDSLLFWILDSLLSFLPGGTR